MKLADGKIGVTYVLLKGTGSIYSEGGAGGSVGYFCPGSRITIDRFIEATLEKYKDWGDVNLGYVTVVGTQFKVTQDASFGNTPSKSASWGSSAAGIAKLSEISVKEEDPQ